MGEFEKARLEKVLNILSKENLCTILESTGSSIADCLNVKKASHPVLLRKVSSRIDELSQEHLKREMCKPTIFKNTKMIDENTSSNS